MDSYTAYHEEMQAAKERAIASGVNPLLKNVTAKLDEARSRAKQQYINQSAAPDAESRKEINRLFSVLTRWFTLILLVFGVGAVLIFVPLAEVTAVFAGLLAVTPDAWFLAALTSVALFIGYLVVCFLDAAHYLELSEEQKPVTLRTRLAGWVQWLGLKQWRGVYADETLKPSKLEITYTQLSKGLFWAKWAIILTSLRGRLDPVIDAHGGKPFWEAINGGLSAITGEETFNIFLTLVVLWALLVLLDKVVKFVYTAFVNTAGRLDLGNAHLAGGVIVSLEVLEAQYLTETYDSMALVMESKKALSAVNPQPPTPDEIPLSY